jgi:hypothetical protein
MSATMGAEMQRWGPIARRPPTPMVMSSPEGTARSPTAQRFTAPTEPPRPRMARPSPPTAQSSPPMRGRKAIAVHPTAAAAPGRHARQGAVASMRYASPAEARVGARWVNARRGVAESAAGSARPAAPRWSPKGADPPSPRALDARRRGRRAADQATAARAWPAGGMANCAATTLARGRTRCAQETTPASRGPSSVDAPPRAGARGSRAVTAGRVKATDAAFRVQAPRQGCASRRRRAVAPRASARPAVARSRPAAPATCARRAIATEASARPAGFWGWRAATTAAACKGKGRARGHRAPGGVGFRFAFALKDEARVRRQRFRAMRASPLRRGIPKNKPPTRGVEGPYARRR